MKVAIYYPWVYLTSGVERMMLELVRRSRHDWTIFTSRYYPEQTYPELKELDIVELLPVSVNRKYSAVVTAAVTILKQKIELDRYDALMVSSEGIGDLITFRNHGIPVICYCHTPLKVIHDRFTRQRYLDSHRKKLPMFYFFSLFFRFIDKQAWKHYRYVFCNSNEVRGRILKAGLASPEKVEVLHPGLDTSLIRPGGDFEKYFLVAGRIKWFKNVELAIEAFHEFRRSYPQFSEFKLVVAGRVESFSEPYFQLLKKQAGEADVSFIRDPTDKELFDLYRNCYALVFPSLNEDWGMVPLEAMGFGKPVIALNRGGPEESVIDGETGFLVEAEPSAMAGAMAKLVADPAMTRKFGETGASRVKQYDWNLFVERIDSYLDTIQK